MKLSIYTLVVALFLICGCKKKISSYQEELLVTSKDSVQNSEKINRFDLDKYALNFTQFLNRFNGKDTLGLSDPNASSAQKRAKIIAALVAESFYKEKNKALLNNFLKDVCFKAPNVFIREDSNLFAKAFCTVSTKNKKAITVKITLQYMQDKQGAAKWGLFGVQSDWLYRTYLTPKATDAIFPNDHDFNFIDMTKKLQAAPFSLLDAHQIEPMSIFLTLIQQKQLSIEYVNKLDLYYLGIPNWAMHISNTGLSKEQGGWKIKRIMTLTQQQKNGFIQNQLYEFKRKAI